MTLHVAVLGCGPAGLLAAHAVGLAGHRPTVYSVYKPSPIGGAQYLHRAIPGITDQDPDGEIKFLKPGNRENYAMRVYGDPQAPTSWDNYEGVHPIWNMRRAYAKLWAAYESRVVDTKLDFGVVRDLSLTHDYVISTVPLKAICRGDHSFTSQDVYITEEDLGLQENEIVMNGMAPNDDSLDTERTSWYRASKIFGHSSAEYPHPPFHATCVKVTKPLKSNCVCHGEVYLAGRYGQWEKGVLIHHAYERALKVLGEL